MYSRVASHDTSRRVLRGLNAAAVGFLWGALYRLWHVGFIIRDGSASLDDDAWWLVVSAGSFIGCHWFNQAPFTVIVAGATAGVLWWAATKR